MKRLLLLTSFTAAACFRIEAQITISAISSAYNQDFNTLAISGTVNSTLPTGWALTETGGGARDNEQYAADAGASTTGDTYSYGSTAASDRAFGCLRSGTLIPTFGAQFLNSTGQTLTALDIAYTGEQWRLGTAARTDRLDFQYSLNATSLSSGSWTDVNALDFTTPNTSTVGAKNGNDSINSSRISSSIIALSIAPAATFWIRWQDADASSSDDGLAVDDFTLTAVPEPSASALMAGLGLLGFAAWQRGRHAGGPGGTKAS